MRPFALLAFMLLALSGCGSGTRSAVSAEDAYIRLSAVPGQPAAAYLTIEATADREALTGVSSPRAGRIEMHETMTSGSMTMMQPLKRIELEGNPLVAFAPGARHLMLFGVDPKLKPGDRADLVLSFARGAPVIVSAKVIGAGDDAGR